MRDPESSRPATGEPPIRESQEGALCFERSTDALDRIKRHAWLNAVVATMRPTAVHSNAKLGTIGGHGALDHQPVLVKDNIDVAGLATTNGTVAGGPIARHDSEVARRIRRSGGLIVGKTNMDEMALGVTCTNSRFPPAVNPWAQDRIPGGSSGGAAVAVAAGLVRCAVGTDTGGSVRTPAAFNGVVGIRPTLGTVSTVGVTRLTPWLDTVGAIGQTVADAVGLMRVIADPIRIRPTGRAARLTWEPQGAPLHTIRLGVLERFFVEESSAGVQEQTLRAIEQVKMLGADVQTITISGAESAGRDAQHLMLRDAYDYLSETGGGLASIHPMVAERVMVGATVDDREYARILERRRSWAQTVATTFADVDFLLTPTSPIVAPFIPEDAASLSTVGRATQFTFPWSLAGVPCISLPAGQSEGLPVGIQLIGPSGGDWVLAKLAKTLEPEFASYLPSLPSIDRHAGTS